MLENIKLKPGDILALKVVSPLYRDIYRTEILEVNDQELVVTMPTNNGKRILLGVGSPLEIILPKDQSSFSSEVLQRGFQPRPHLVLQLPFFLYNQRQERPRVITITSGKGGVGKTTFTINMAITLAQMGQRVFVIDADLGTANIDVLLNLQPKYNLTHIINREKEILDIIVDGPGGIKLIPGGSGLQYLADMEQWQFNRLISSLQTLENYADIILIDTGAGLGKNVISFALAADNIIIITTPEPHSITDAYAIMKVLDEQNHTISPYLVLNRVECLKEYQEVAGKMTQVVNRFLSIKIQPLGHILEDPAIPKANRRMEPFILNNSPSPATRSFHDIAQRILDPNQDFPLQAEGRSFFSKIRELLSR